MCLYVIVLGVFIKLFYKRITGVACLIGLPHGQLNSHVLSKINKVLKCSCHIGKEKQNLTEKNIALANIK